MIDLHNHILPRLDDGARDIEESLEIGKRFVSEGVKAVAATPHLNPLDERTASAELVRSRVDEVRSAVDEAGIRLDIHTGNELFLTPEAPELLQSRRAYSLAGSRYVLVEISLNSVLPPVYFEDTLFRLQVAGFVPVLAHPERYPFVRNDPEALDELIHRDVVLQVTAPSLLGHYGREVQKTGTSLLQRRAYALGASDRHRPEQDRSLRSLHARVTDLVDLDYADLLLKANPARVLADETLVRSELLPPEKRGFWVRLISAD